MINKNQNVLHSKFQEKSEHATITIKNHIDIRYVKMLTLQIYYMNHVKWFGTINRNVTYHNHT